MASPLTGGHVARSLGPAVIALVGAASLAVAMGIGRFAFTPLLPMMLADGAVDLAAGSRLATANYVGYLVGAVACSAQPWAWARWPGLPRLTGSALARWGLVATVLLTLGMALPVPAAWAALRFAAGMASAFVLVFTSGWCLARLARAGAPALGGLIFTGPGIGIAGSGLAASAMVAAGWSAAAGWLVFAGLAAALTAGLWTRLRGADDPVGRPATSVAQPAASVARPVAARGTTSAPGPATTARVARVGPDAGAATPPVPAARAPGGPAELALLTLAYGLAGFGYIVTATFLPVIARAALPGSAWLDLFWPAFGLGVTAGAALATRVPARLDARRVLVGCYLMQAAGIGASLWVPSFAGFAIGSLLLGLPFTAITFFCLQEARRLRPQAAASLMGLITSAYGIGQIAGPPLVASLLERSASHAEGFTRSLEAAAAALLLGAAIHGLLSRAYPRGGGARSAG